MDRSKMQLCAGFDCSEGTLPGKWEELDGKYYCDYCLIAELRKKLKNAWKQWLKVCKAKEDTIDKEVALMGNTLRPKKVKG